MNERKAKYKEGLKGEKRRKKVLRDKRRKETQKREENDDKCLSHYVLLKG